MILIYKIIYLVPTMQVTLIFVAIKEIYNLLKLNKTKINGKKKQELCKTASMCNFTSTIQVATHKKVLNFIFHYINKLKKYKLIHILKICTS